MNLTAGLLLCSVSFPPICDSGILLTILIRIILQSIILTTFKRWKFLCSILSITFCAGTSHGLKLTFELNYYTRQHSFTGLYFFLIDQIRHSIEAVEGLAFQHWAAEGL